MLGGTHGTLECGFFEGRDLTGVGFEGFSVELDAYTEWYRCRKLERSLGWGALGQRCEEPGHAA